MTAPSTSSVPLGQTIQTKVFVWNNSTIDAEDVSVNLPLSTTIHSGSPSVTTSDSSDVVNVAAGGIYTFTINYIGTGVGGIELNADVNFTDSLNKNTYTSATTDTDVIVTITSASAAVLEVQSAVLSPANASHDQDVTLDIALKNVGNISATNVEIRHPSTNIAWNFQKYGTANATENANTETAKTIAVNETKYFQFTFNPSSTGTLAYRFYATGTGVAASVYKTSNYINIVNPANLVISPGNFYVAPATVIGKNSSFNVVVKVTNNGDAPANTVSTSQPGIVAVTGPPTPDPVPTLKNSPNPATATCEFS